MHLLASFWLGVKNGRIFHGLKKNIAQSWESKIYLLNTGILLLGQVLSEKKLETVCFKNVQLQWGKKSSDELVFSVHERALSAQGCLLKVSGWVTSLKWQVAVTGFLLSLRMVRSFEFPDLNSATIAWDNNCYYRENPPINNNFLICVTWELEECHSVWNHSAWERARSVPKERSFCSVGAGQAQSWPSIHVVERLYRIILTD